VETAALILITFIAFYPVVTAATWVAGGLVFRVFDEHSDADPPAGGWPSVTVLIPAFNEEATIATCVRAALAVDYPDLEVLVLDDGSTDRTVERAQEAGDGDRRLEVIRDPVNRGKAERLNGGFQLAKHALIATTDADTHLHPLALKLLVGRLSRSERIAAVAGAPHVTNRNRVLTVLQVLEAEAIIGLVRRTQAVTGSVGTVAGVLGLFRRDAVLSVGGYDGRMATEDIDLSWRLLLAGWHTTFEPRALVGMQVPSTMGALWAQRKRWARGQGEVLRIHTRHLMSSRTVRLWPLVIESAASLLWVVAVIFSFVVGVLALVLGADLPLVGFGLTWGIAIAVIALMQLAFALGIDFGNDRRAPLAFLLGPIYPLGFWLISALAALRAETVSLFKGPVDERVTWEIPREAPE
jgi:poly-beta-1,6-N-acetyl-D-glucosamine synthase